MHGGSWSDAAMSCFFAGGFNGSAVSSSKLGFLGGFGFSKVLTGRGLRAFRGLWLEAGWRPW